MPILRKIIVSDHMGWAKGCSKIGQKGHERASGLIPGLDLPNCRALQALRWSIAKTFQG
jgi:hypothetical protein